MEKGIKDPMVYVGIPATDKQLVRLSKKVGDEFLRQIALKDLLLAQVEQTTNNEKKIEKAVSKMADEIFPPLKREE